MEEIKPKNKGNNGIIAGVLGVCLVGGGFGYSSYSKNQQLQEFNSQVNNFAMFALKNNVDEIIGLDDLLEEANSIIADKSVDKIEKFIWQLENLEQQSVYLIELMNNGELTTEALNNLSVGANDIQVEISEFENEANIYGAAYSEEINHELNLSAEEEWILLSMATERFNEMKPATYLLPNSNSQYLSTSDISHLSEEELRIARNEIYARHGRIFASSDLQQYFNSQSWYNGTVSADNFSESWLSDIEKKNVELISNFEKGTTSQTTANTGTYILPNSNTLYLSSFDIDHLSNAQLRLARNEIYARHGRIFASSDLQNYFNSQSWYKGTVSAANFSESVLNDAEKANVQLIQDAENGIYYYGNVKADDYWN
ncbi:MAG: hypothetical protein ATN36_07710 [Epulopiscium sp. Nele67-Bin005]|nr:MAG: hypothetical protein ATN36_07710 [Epulopiscium sp. Nele67-Bin005]